jgi:predicted phage tail component-like protein
MNYIILNGVKSTIVQGLLIQELPPISKPQMRSTVETIDGRDGDIITRLGYSAYDKVLTIGLKKDADINDVISYFVNNDRGQVTFSNEQDFYYRFDLLEAIDFERLIRFKQARVNFHVQPFKFSCSEGNTELILQNGSVNVVNHGNIYSKPVLTVRARDVVTVSLNNLEVFSIAFNENTAETIIIDTAGMEAYSSSTGALKNRAVTGNYNNFYLPVGMSAIQFTGNVVAASLSKYSRWI